MKLSAPINPKQPQEQSFGRSSVGTGAGSLFDPLGVTYEIDHCDCEDCQDRDEPCAMDCDSESECDGCRESRLGQEEIGFEIDWARGVR